MAMTPNQRRKLAHGSNALIMTTCNPRPLTASRNAMPFIFGIRTSQSTKRISGSASSIDMPSAPSRAAVTSYPKPSSIVARMRRRLSSSSTIRIFRPVALASVSFIFRIYM